MANAPLDPRQQEDREDTSPEGAQQFGGPAKHELTYRTAGNEPSTHRGEPLNKSSDSKTEPSRDNLKNAEENGTSAGTDSADPEQARLVRHENQVGKGYTEGIKANLSARTWLFNRRRAALGGGLIGTIVAAFLFFTFFSGPFQFIHIAQLMAQSHFSVLQDQSDNRGWRIIQYARYRNMDKVENVRLGVIGNKIANNIEARFNEVGIRSSYTEVFGFRDGLVIDPDKLPPTSDFGDLKNMPPDEIKTHFKEKYGVDIETGGGNLKGKEFIVDTRKLNYRQNVLLTRSAVKTAGVSKKYSAISARIMGKRAGVTWHPIKRLDNKILATVEARFLEWKKSFASDTKKGIVADIKKEPQPKIDPNADDSANQRTVEEANSANKAADDVISEGRQTGDALAGGDTESTSKLKSSVRAKLGGGLAAVGLVCTARGLAIQADDIKQEQVIFPLIRYSVRFIALGNQVMSGQEVDMEQLGFNNQLLHDKNSSWSDANSIRARQGQPQNGPAPSDTLQKIDEGTPFDFLKTGTPGAILSPVCGPTGAVIQTVLGFFGGPISAVAGYAVGLAATPFVDNIAQWLAGDAIDIFAKGADAGYNIDYGARLAANAQATSAGGTVLESGEEAQLNTFADSLYKTDFRSKGIAYRLFNLYDGRSAVSKLIDQSSPNSSQNITKVASAVFNLGHSFSSITSAFNGRVSAAPIAYNYGFPAVGFSESEMNNDTVRNPYENADSVVSDILPAHPDYIDRAKKCFGVGIDKTTYDVTSWEASAPKLSDIKSEDCRDDSTEWLKVRFYIFDTQTAESAACYEGAEEFCSDVGFGDSISADFPTGAQPGGTDGPVEQGSQAQLAQKILDYRKTGRYNCDNNGDCIDLQKVVQGQSLSGSYGCTARTLDPRVLQVILYAIQVGNFKIGTYALCGDHSSDGPNGHSGGLAVDISSVNGTAIVANTPQARANTLSLATFLHNLTGELAPRQLITAGYGNQFDQAFLDLEIPNASVFGGSASNSTNAGHRNHIHVGY